MNAHWRQLRDDLILEMDNRCMVCRKEQTDTSLLQLHHLTYKNFGHEKELDVLLVCPKCHKLLHRSTPTLERPDLWSQQERLEKLRAPKLDERSADNTKRRWFDWTPEYQDKMGGHRNPKRRQRDRYGIVPLQYW